MTLAKKTMIWTLLGAFAVTSTVGCTEEEIQTVATVAVVGLAVAAAAGGSSRNSNDHYDHDRRYDRFHHERDSRYDNRYSDEFERRRHDWERFNEDRYGRPPRWGVDSWYDTNCRGVPSVYFSNLCEIKLIQMSQHKMAGPTAPKATATYLQYSKEVGKQLGLPAQQSMLVVDALNRAAIGDYIGLKDIGLDKQILKEMYISHGLLKDDDLARVASKLKLSSLDTQNALIRLVYISRR